MVKKVSASNGDVGRKREQHKILHAAEMMSCSIGNSKSQLHKARMKLRTLLSARAEMPVSQVAAA